MRTFEESREIINKLIIETFKNILTIEEKAIKRRGIKDLSMSEMHAIEAIGVGDGKTMGEVAEYLNITMGTLTASITKLEKKGYVIRTKHPDDRRVVIASLTRKGVLAEKIHRNFHDEMIDRLMIDLKLEEDEVLIKALKNVNDFFIEEYNKTDEI